MLLAFFVLSVQLFIAIIEFKLTVLAGFVLVPFALFGQTAFLAERVLGNVISSGIKLMVLAIVVGIGSSLFGTLIRPSGEITLTQAASTTVLSFASLARYFPKEVVGRANAALGVLNMGTAFGLQCLAGLIIARWPADAGHYPAQAHQVALAAGLALQLVGLAVFLAPRRRPQPVPMALAVARALGVDPSIAAAMPARYAAALSAWRQHVARTRRQATAWRLAAVASMALCVGLGGALSLALSRPAVALHMVRGNPLMHTPSNGASSETNAMMILLPWESSREILGPPIQDRRTMVEPDEP